MQKIDEDREDFKADAFHEIRGIILSCADIDGERKIDLLAALDAMKGVRPCSRAAMRFALEFGKEEGVW